jgi:hypothetical protein
MPSAAPAALFFRAPQAKKNPAEAGFFAGRLNA